MNLRQAGELANKAAAVQWVKWVHPNTQPANSHAEKQANVLKAAIIPTHCAKCLNMNGCCFAKDKCPESPLHSNCHCKAERIDNINVTAECPIEKFTGYIFSKNHIKKGKMELFIDWGFTIADSEKLKAELEKQAYTAYLLGKYTLNKLDSYGQRINIIIKLSCPNGNIVSFTTGWLVYPNGTIINSTPYGDK